MVGISDEAAIMARARVMSLDILRSSCNSTEILGIVENIANWYDGSRGSPTLSDEQLPLAARMIAVAEAFDAMTTDRVYRPALSQERAMAELDRIRKGELRIAGFEPNLSVYQGMILPEENTGDYLD